MYACKCMCTCKYPHVCAYACRSEAGHRFVYVHMHAHVFVYLYIYVSVNEWDDPFNRRFFVSFATNWFFWFFPGSLLCPVLSQVVFHFCLCQLRQCCHGYGNTE
jgi:hypothetical protein